MSDRIGPERVLLEIDHYSEAIDKLHMFAKIILFEFLEKKHVIVNKDVIIRNIIARTVTALRGILSLYIINDYHDCWILLRCILDRLFHLRALEKDNAYEIFEKWSFKKQYEYMNRIKSDPLFSKYQENKFFTVHEKEKARYQAVQRENPKWKRPKPEEIAKDMNLDFLYKYGYDYSSAYVHPMATDGQNDFLTEVNLSEMIVYADQRMVLQNSCLATVLTIQEGLNSSSLSWRAIVYTFLEDLMNFLGTGKYDYIVDLLKIISVMKNSDLCKKTN